MIQESLNNITALLAEQLDRTADEPFRRSLAVRVDYWRSTLLQRSLEKHPEQRKLFTQTLLVPLITASPVANVAVSLAPIAQSKRQIPIPLRGTTRYDYVGAIDGASPFREASIGTLAYLQAGKYSKNLTYFELVNYSLRVLTSSVIPECRIDGVFDKPVDVMQFNSTAGDNCDGWDQPYPVSGDILQMIVQYILQVDYQRIDKPVPQIQTGINETP